MGKQAGLAATILALLAAVSSASATASLTCDADDRFQSSRIQAVVGHAGSVNTVEAKVTIKGRGPGADLVVDLAIEHLVQHWTTGRDVRLRFFRYDPAYVLDLTIETRGRKDDEKERPGTYRLEFTNSPPGPQPTTVNRTGRASCTIG